MTGALFLRVLKQVDKEAELLAAVARVRHDGAGPPVVYETIPKTFTNLPGSPFVYWVSPALRRKLMAFPPFEAPGRAVRQGLATGDDFQFVRAWWEVPVAHFATNLSQERARPSQNPVWVPHIKAGASQPFFSPITVVVNWGDDGVDLKNFRDGNGKLRSRPQNTAYYFRPGFSWTRRAVRFMPYAVPSGCISTVSRYQAFPRQGEEFVTLGVAASTIVTAFLRFYGEKFEWPNFLVDNLKSLPWPQVTIETRTHLEQLVNDQVRSRRNAYQQHEPFLEFTLPNLMSKESEADALAFDPRSLLGDVLESMVSGSYGIAVQERAELERDLLEAIEARTTRGSLDSGDAEEGGDTEDDERDFVLATDMASQHEAAISYCVGCVLGRWDARMAIDPALAANLAGPFDPLPICPPGMLVGPDALPAHKDGIVSEEWLHARTDAITLPPENAVQRPTMRDGEYPLEVAWEGILVDDPEHPQDVVTRVRAVLDLLWGERADAVEQETCELLGVKSLREYFGNPRGFLEDHVRRYSKSRRKAPIYWLLQSSKRSYGLWLYYHRLDADLLFKSLTNYVDPKIQREEGRLADLRSQKTQAGAKGSVDRRADRVIEGQEALIAELRDFRDKLNRAASLGLKPDLDDGVVLNAAPLWELMPWKVAKDYWQELLKGEYAWSSIGKQLRAKNLVTVT